MLYNKSAVKNRKPVTKKQIELARESPLFRLNEKNIEEIKSRIYLGCTDIYGYMKEISEWMELYINYDEKHKFRGIRTASQVLKHQKGHCIEQAILFYAIAKKLEFPVTPLIVKNPKGYDGSHNIRNLGIHAFMLFDYKGNKYAADFLGVKKYSNKGFCICEQKLNEREFTAFCLQDSGEDFAEHENYKNAFSTFNAASLIDPNNYVICVSAADAALNKGNLKKAEKWYKEAIEIAPDIADTHWAYADFLFRVEDSKRSLRKAYVKAAKKDTKDIQILFNLEERLYSLGERELSKEIRDKRLSIQNSKKLQGYFR